MGPLKSVYCQNKYIFLILIYDRQVGSYLAHSWVLFYFGHGSEQAWWGRGRRHLQDAAEVGGVNRRLLWVEQ